MGSSVSVTESNATAFMSYSREDNESLRFIEPLKRDVGNRFRSTLGRNIEIFVDRDNIPLGVSWRQALSKGAANALVFFAFVTGSYLKSETCRAEFNEFRNASASAGVPSLLIPVLPNGPEFLKHFPADDIAEFVKDTQYLDISEAVLDGADSSNFRRAVQALTDRTIEVSLAAEEFLARRAVEEGGPVGFNRDGVEDASPRGSDDNDQPGLLELVEEFSEISERLAPTVEPMGTLIVKLGEVFGSYKSASSFGSKDAIILSRQIDPISSELEKRGGHIKALMNDADRIIREMQNLSAPTELSSSIDDALREMFSTADSVGESAEQLEHLLNAFRVPEAMSSALRRSLKPARRGVTDLLDTVDLFEGWRSRFQADPADRTIAGEGSLPS